MTPPKLLLCGPAFSGKSALAGHLAGSHPVRQGINAAVLERHRATFEWPGEDEPHRVLPDVSELKAWLAAAAVRW